MIWFFACTGEVVDTSASDSGVDASRWSADQEERILALSPLPDIPDDTTNAWADDPDAAHLGQWLFYDERLSGSGEHSCATCHDPAFGFADGLQLSEAAGTTGRHAPTALNIAWNRWFFWDGRCDSAWCQALGPLESPVEQATTRSDVAILLYEDAELREAYEQVFGAMPDLSDRTRIPANARPDDTDLQGDQNVNWLSIDTDDQVAVNGVFANVGKAIAAYERKLVREDAPFDGYVAALAEGEGEGLSDEALYGLELYLGEGACHFCHSGPNFTNREFHNIGLGPRDWLDAEDRGRYDGIATVQAGTFNGAGDFSDDPVTGAAKLAYLARGDEQLGQFKTPSLRNVTDTAPYMHGGHFETLEDVVTYYKDLEETPVYSHAEDLLDAQDAWGDEEVAALVAFLESLTGAPLDAGLTSAPQSPIP